MRVIIGCERSGVVRRAFRALGHDAWSCDLEPADDGSEFHYQQDALIAIRAHGPWDLLIAHPPCTYLCSMGIWWNKKRPERIPHTVWAFDFVKRLFAAQIPRIAIENPKGYLNSHWRKPDCIVQPWQFGDAASKATHLWLKNLPPLLGFHNAGEGRFYTKSNGHRMAAWSHKVSGTRKDERARIASQTFPGIAAAMANQWGGKP